MGVVRSTGDHQQLHHRAFHGSVRTSTDKALGEDGRIGGPGERAERHEQDGSDSDRTGSAVPDEAERIGWRGWTAQRCTALLSVLGMVEWADGVGGGEDWRVPAWPRLRLRSVAPSPLQPPAHRRHSEARECERLSAPHLPVHCAAPSPLSSHPSPTTSATSHTLGLSSSTICSARRLLLHSTSFTASPLLLLPLTLLCHFP